MKQIYNSFSDDAPGTTATKGLKGSLMGHLMMSSKGGDKIAFDEV